MGNVNRGKEVEHVNLEGSQELGGFGRGGELVRPCVRTCHRPSKVGGASSSRGPTSVVVEHFRSLNPSPHHSEGGVVGEDGALGHEAVARKLKLALFIAREAVVREEMGDIFLEDAGPGKGITKAR